MNAIHAIGAAGVKTWFKRGTFAVLDQGLFSGANFLVNVLLARWLTPEEYGAFAVAMSVFYLLAGFHTAVLTEPMMVFGAGKYRKHFRKYLAILLHGHWGISALIALALGIAAFVFAHYGSQAMARALTGLAVASPFLLLIWLVRRACYVPMQPVWAAAGSGINLAVTLAGLFLLWCAGLLSSLSGLVLLGAAAAIASFALLALPLRPRVSGFVGNPTPAMVLGDHWGYGSWNILGFLLYWVSGHFFMLLVPIFLGLAAGAAVAAVLILYRPISQLMQALSLLLLPAFSRMTSESNSDGSLRWEALRVGILLSAAVALYSIFVSVVGKTILETIYKGKYNDYWLLIPILGIGISASTMTSVFINALKSSGLVREAICLLLVQVSGTLLLSIPLLAMVGLYPAIAVGVVTYPLNSWLAYKRLSQSYRRRGM